MPKRINNGDRALVLRMLAEGHDHQTIADRLSLARGQVAAIAAHVTMGTYRLPKTVPKHPDLEDNSLFRPNNAFVRISGQVFLGKDVQTDEDVFWNPNPRAGTANPHVLILGESGYGKTYATACLLAELAQQGVHSIVFDYAQGFSSSSLPLEFTTGTGPFEIDACRNGVNINPLQIFASDLHGPINVAQRVADTFGRVYTKIGIQQHAILRQAIIDLFAENQITQTNPASWIKEAPAFSRIKEHLDRYAATASGPSARAASLVTSHISTVFVFNTFRSSGQSLAWEDILESKRKIWVIRLNGLEHSLERTVTEFLLWNLIGYIETLGTSSLRCFIVLDEAHRLSFEQNSPAERFLREGRKFGLGLLLASQQPDDFSSVAFANTATKLIFQISDERGTVARHLVRKVVNSGAVAKVHHLITRLPRGCAYAVINNRANVVRIANFATRALNWKTTYG